MHLDTPAPVPLFLTSLPYYQLLPWWHTAQLRGLRQSIGFAERIPVDPIQSNAQGASVTRDPPAVHLTSHQHSLIIILWAVVLLEGIIAGAKKKSGKCKQEPNIVVALALVK